MISATQRIGSACHVVGIVCLCLGWSSAEAQILSTRNPTNAVRALEDPPGPVSRKERRFIREVLEPELLLRVDTVKTKIVRTNYPIARVAITNPEIIDINEFDSMEVEIRGKQVGETTMTLWFVDEDNETHVLRYLVEVSPSSGHQKSFVEELQDQINEAFPNSQIQLILIRDKLLVRGQVRDADEAEKILSVLDSRAGGGSSGVGSNAAGQGLLAGLAAAANGGSAGANTNGASPRPRIQVINMLRVPGVQQVMLKVRVAELSRNSSREIGADLRAIVGSLTLGTLTGGLDDFSAILDGDDLRFFIRAVTSNGYGKILAEPTLVTISGKPARFLAGGEFPVPTAVGVSGVEAATTTFREFGTQLEFTPTVLDKDLIRLQVSPSFSSLNSDASVNGIPGLNSRMVETTVDLREGQWLAIAGLIQDEQGGGRSELPFLGRLPGVGRLFGRQNTNRQETELIVLVSPQLVHPLESDELPPMLPGMEIMDPTEHDFFHRGLIEGYAGFHYRSTVQPEIEAQDLGSARAAHQHRCRNGCRANCRCNASPFAIQEEYLLGPSGFSE